MTNPRDRLLDDGYCIVPDVLDRAFLAELGQITDRLLALMSPEEARRQRSTGSMIPVVRDHRLVRLIVHPPALDALEAMGFDDIRFQSGYIISKPPNSPRLFWHYDWGFWSHPISRERRPAQLFLMYYLSDTTPANGCLRVIPRSHVEDNLLHAELANAHTPALTEAQDLSRAEFQIRPDEVAVPVKAGDLVVGDSRILHAAHSNETDQRRTVITLWYHPRFLDLPEELRAAFATRRDPVPGDWPSDALALYRSIACAYAGRTAPAEFSRGRPRMHGS